MRAPVTLALLLGGLAVAQDSGGRDGGVVVAPPATPQIEVEVQGLRSSQGKVWALLYDDAKAFPTKPLQAKQSFYVPIANQKATVVFKDVAPGVYAIGLIHDENDNAKVDTNFIGIPNEGMGSSRNAKGFMGPPKFDDAKVTVGAQGLKLQILIKY